MSWHVFHGQELVISESSFLACRVDLRTISSSIANTMGNDLSGNLSNSATTVAASASASTSHNNHDASAVINDPTSSFYPMNSSNEGQTEATVRPKRSKPRVVDAAEKVRHSYWNAGVSKVRMLFG